MTARRRRLPPDPKICGGPEICGCLNAAIITATCARRWSTRRSSLIEEKGPTGLHPVGGRQAAPGVTPAAVYRHFEGREDLIAEAARQGYEIFADLMEYAYESGQPSALAASRRRAAPIWPSRGSIPATTWRCSKAASRSTARRNWPGGGAGAACWNAPPRPCRSISRRQAPAAAMFSAHIWAMSHGVVELFARGAARPEARRSRPRICWRRDRDLPARARPDPAGRLSFTGPKPRIFSGSSASATSHVHASRASAFGSQLGHVGLVLPDQPALHPPLGGVAERVEAACRAAPSARQQGIDPPIHAPNSRFFGRPAASLPGRSGGARW
jgi:AcrR family transcriptional regulator